ncbi:MAG: DUF3656 domain-containing protein [Lachnospiraceae bacterium]
MKKPEVLAPAGSFDALRAAICAGADAVYVGGSRFGARAYADNFNQDELCRAIEYVHRYGKKLYLTVNTLFKEAERQELYEYLLPYYQCGLDAVIVQDMGVATLIRRWFPDMELHASTQMMITGVDGALALKDIGAVRIVPARELSLKEIRDIKASVDIEIETFVHGALCYCYSGQCFLSSMIGGRSGNRGRCAQPCRLPYDTGWGKDYSLSLKDICTIDCIPDLVLAGIDSFKIEGRMKSPFYVALVTSMYRKYLDQYWDAPEKTFEVCEQDKIQLLDAFNRGGFSKGYYYRHNGADMMSMDRPNHQGVYLGRIEQIRQNYIEFTAQQDIQPQDIIEISVPGKEPVVLTTTAAVKKGKTASVKAMRIRDLSVGLTVYRTRNHTLIHDVESRFLNQDKQIPISLSAEFQLGKPARVTATYGKYEASVFGQIVQRASKQSATPEDVRKKLSSTGTTVYDVEKMDIFLDEGVFLPVKELKALRRAVLEALEMKIANSYARIPMEKDDFHERVRCKNQLYSSDSSDMSQCVVSVCDKSQLAVALKNELAERIEVPFSLYSLQDWEKIIIKCHAAGKSIYIIFPKVFRTKQRKALIENQELFLSLDFDGVVVSNLDALYFVSKTLAVPKPLILQHTLYAYNRIAIDFYERNFPVSGMVMPMELNKQELKTLPFQHPEIQLYGRMSVMISAGCQKKNRGLCDHKEEIVRIRDRYGKEYPVITHCQECYNEMLYYEPVNLLSEYHTLRSMGIDTFRLGFTTETAEETEQVLKDTGEVFMDFHQAIKRSYLGHFDKGIE